MILAIPFQKTFTWLGFEWMDFHYEKIMFVATKNCPMELDYN